MQTYFLEAYAQLLHDAVFVEGLYPLESRTSNGAKTNKAKGFEVSKII